MSYRKTGNISYNQRRQVMRTFRDEWSKGLSEALTKAAQMEKDGWNVDTARTLMATQAKERAKELSEKGFAAETIPIAKWDGEDVVLLASKPVPKKPLPPAPAGSSNEMVQFFASFAKGLSDGGVVSSNDHSVIFIEKGANPTGQDSNPQSWLQMADSIKENPKLQVGVIVKPSLFVSELEKAKVAGKDMVTFKPELTGAIAADLLLPAVRVLSLGPYEVKLYVNDVGVAMLENRDGDRILLAPNYAVDPVDTNVKDVTELLLGTNGERTGYTMSG